MLFLFKRKLLHNYRRIRIKIALAVANPDTLRYRDIPMHFAYGIIQLANSKNEVN